MTCRRWLAIRSRGVPEQPVYAVKRICDFGLNFLNGDAQSLSNLRIGQVVHAMKPEHLARALRKRTKSAPKGMGVNHRSHPRGRGCPVTRRTWSSNVRSSGRI